MNSALVQIQVFYEIASVIGKSAYLEEMVRQSLSAYLHKLNCFTGMVLQARASDKGSVAFRPVLTIPRKACASPALEAALLHISSPIPQGECDGFYQKLPLTAELDGGKYCYVMHLRDFGILLLVKAGRPFPESLVKSLSRLNDRFAEACLVCLHNEELARVNEMLTKEIGERQRAEAALRLLLEELETRVEKRTVDLVLANRRLEAALANVKTLSGLLPICSVCKKIRDDQGYWKQIESYITSHSEAMFTHGICPECAKRLYKEYGITEE